MDTDTAGGERKASRRVSFAIDTADDIPVDEQKDKDAPEIKVDGIIGQLELYRSGAVKMRLGNDILYDV
jgi:DNA-directed RNA polymerase III subunit RPC4